MAGSTKPPLGLVPTAGLIAASQVMRLGADKYGPFNWRDIPVRSMVYTDAAMRHILSFNDGEDLDPESKVTHLAHAAASLLILIDAISCGTCVDDRPTPGRAGQMIADIAKAAE